MNVSDFGQLLASGGILALFYEWGIGQFRHDEIKSVFISMFSLFFVMIGAALSW